MTPQDTQKHQAAEAVLSYIEDNMIIGVGSGTTVHYFIDALAKIKGRIDGAVASSNETAKRLKAMGIPVYELNTVGELPLYIDGADEINAQLQMVKGGGGALTREKIIAAASKQFICIADQSKKVGILGRFPVSVEVIPMARSYVARELVKLGGDPEYREDFITDNGNVILDVHNLQVMEPIKLEQQINNIAGVVCNGIFAQRPADILLLAGVQGVEVIK